MPLTVYCTEEDLNRYLSDQGVVAFADHDQDGTSDTGVVDDCIAQGTEEINLYAGQFYASAGLASSTLVTRWCVVLSSTFLCERRGNPVPESLRAEFERILTTLERVRTGEMRLPGVAMSADMRPTVSNLRPVRGATDGPIRVDQVTSPKVPTDRPQKVDYFGGTRYGY